MSLQIIEGLKGTYTEKNDLEISLRNLEYSDSFSKIRKYQFPNLEKT